MTKTFKHVHLSSRYDRPVGTLEKVTKEYIRNGASVITYTEVDSERREKVLRDFPGWGFVAGDKTGRDDCAIMWDSKEWEVKHKETFNVATYMAGNIGAAIAVLEHRDTREQVLFSVIHTPSSVEGNGRVSGSRANEWYRAVRLWRKMCEAIARRRNVKKFVMVADWNLNLKAKWVQRVVKNLFGGYSFAWNLRDLPVGGTHGPRLIDWTMLKGVKVARRPKIHRSTPASDHKGYDEVLSI